MKQLVNGIRLNVLEQGDGPLTLVFMHYFGGSALEWQGVMEQLSGQYRCLVVDLRGHGDSDGPPDGYSVDEMADDVICLIEELNVGAFVLIGHSMSGKVALAVAAGTANYTRPAGLRQLVLVSPSPPVPEPISDDERQKLLGGYGQRSEAEQMLKNITANDVSIAVQEQIIADDLRTAKPAWDAWLNTGSREDISARMLAVDLPVHIIVGTKDQALPPDVQRKLVLPYLKNATLETVEGAGHLLPWETPDVVSEFIAKKVVG